MSGACSSALYVVYDTYYFEIFYAYNVGYFDLPEMEAFIANFTTVYESSLYPSEVTLALLQAGGSQVQTEQEEVYHDALAVRNAAALYCAQTTCTATQTLTLNELEAYTTEINWSKYDVHANGDVLATLSGSDWLISMERTGTGSYEFPSGVDPINVDETAVIIDTN
jgi:archaellum component FlaF (FlaF/FlaG flagellin family)